MELALLVASLTTMLESSHHTWGPMASIPLLVLCMLRSNPVSGKDSPEAAPIDGKPLKIILFSVHLLCYRLA